MEFALDIDVNQLSIPGKRLTDYLVSISDITKTYVFKELDVVDISNHVFNSLFNEGEVAVDLDVLQMYLDKSTADEVEGLIGKTRIQDIPALDDFKVIRYALTCATLNELSLEGILHKSEKEDATIYVLDSIVAAMEDSAGNRIFSLDQSLVRSYNKYLEVIDVTNDNILAIIDVNGQKLECDFGIGILVYIYEASKKCKDEDLVYVLLSVLDATVSRGDTDIYQDQRLLSELRSK